MAKDSVVILCKLTVFVRSAGLCVYVHKLVHVWPQCFCPILSFKLQCKLHETLATDNHYFYAQTLLEY